MDRDPAIQVFKDEMEQVFALMDPFCASARCDRLIGHMWLANKLGRLIGHTWLPNQTGSNRRF